MKWKKKLSKRIKIISELLIYSFLIENEKKIEPDVNFQMKIEFLQRKFGGFSDLKIS